MSKTKVKITQRYRPDSEVSRWIWDEVKQLEDDYDELEAAYTTLEAECDNAQAKLAMAVEALKFYADIEQYEEGSGANPPHTMEFGEDIEHSYVAIYGDDNCGDLARQALEKISEVEK